MTELDTDTEGQGYGYYSNVGKPESLDFSASGNEAYGTYNWQFSI